jgi:mannitol/fructose-specific phosphotransferase system IIA component (Ntr-type)
VLSELLPPERVRVPLGSHSKAALFRELVDLALGPDGASLSAGVVAAVEAREADVSTAMGGGLAVPHGRTDLVSDVRLAAGIANVPDYSGPDGAPVRVVFLVLTPLACTGQHVKVLARIARLMHNPVSRAALLAAGSADDFVAVVRQAEGALVA